MENIKTFEGFWDFLKDKNPIKKTLHYQELYLLKKRVKAKCDELRIKNYTINDDGTVDVNGDLNIYLIQDRIKKDEQNSILINFNKISGDVDISLRWGNWTRMFRGRVGQLPFTFNEVTGNFHANHNMLETLIGCPKKVGGCFDVRSNRLRTLEGSPETVGGNFDVSDNDLKTLEGLSPRIDGTLDFNSNKITSFDYYTDCKLTRNGIEDNPIYLVLYIVLKRGRIGIKDLSSIIDLFKSYDPVHPGHSHSSVPILYLDRLELFMSEVLDREIDIKKEIESEKLSHFSSHYSGGSVRFLLEDYYSIKY
jgi:hypothetical protein